mmetsp:Transcript_34292/g.72688  ORF Transcript_34292/g.72688 Transcript_34292/m.72688 type:complete len:326 (+) Transcript_34292:91-1068(+)
MRVALPVFVGAAAEALTTPIERQSFSTAECNAEQKVHSTVTGLTLSADQTCLCEDFTTGADHAEGAGVEKSQRYCCEGEETGVKVFAGSGCAGEASASVEMTPVVLASVLRGECYSVEEGGVAMHLAPGTAYPVSSHPTCAPATTTTSTTTTPEGTAQNSYPAGDCSGDPKIAGWVTSTELDEDERCMCEVYTVGPGQAIGEPGAVIAMRYCCEEDGVAHEVMLTGKCADAPLLTFAFEVETARALMNGECISAAQNIPFVGTTVMNLTNSQAYPDAKRPKCLRQSEVPQEPEGSGDATDVQISEPSAAYGVAASLWLFSAIQRW